MSGVDRQQVSESFWLRGSACLMAFLCFGLPLDDTIHFALFVVLVLLAATGLITRKARRWGAPSW